MRLARASVYRQYQPFADGPYVCRGHVEEGFDSTIVRLETETGLVGWGEMAPLGSFYSPAFAAGARAGAAELLPRLMGHDPGSIAVINQTMDYELMGHPYVKSPIDMACWDLLGKATGMPLAELTGGRFGTGAALYRSVSQASPEQMAETAAAYVDRGYRRIQVKVGADPTDDVERLLAVQRAVATKALLIADANGSWQVDDAIRFASQADGVDYYLEQPCMTIDECARVRSATGRPMILDESIETPADLLAGHTAGVAQGVTIKLSRVGGISKARHVRDMAVSLGIRVTIEDTGGSDIDTAATTHLMMSTPETARFHTVDFMNWVTVSNASGMPPTSDGRIEAPAGPGLGLEVREDALGEPILEIG